MGWAVYFNRRFPRGTSIFFRWRQSLYRWFPTFQDCVDYCLSTPGCKALQFQLYKRTFVRRRSGRPRFYRVKQNARTYSFGICRLSTSSNVCGSSANFRDIQPQVTNFLYRLEVEYAVLQTDSCFLTDLSAGNGQANSPGKWLLMEYIQNNTRLILWYMYIIYGYNIYQILRYIYRHQVAARSVAYSCTPPFW